MEQCKFVKWSSQIEKSLNIVTTRGHTIQTLRVQTRKPSDSLFFLFSMQARLFLLRILQARYEDNDCLFEQSLRYGIAMYCPCTALLPRTPVVLLATWLLVQVHSPCPRTSEYDWCEMQPGHLESQGFSTHTLASLFNTEALYNIVLVTLNQIKCVRELARPR